MVGYQAVKKFEHMFSRIRKYYFIKYYRYLKLLLKIRLEALVPIYNRFSTLLIAGIVVNTFCVNTLLTNVTVELVDRKRDNFDRDLPNLPELLYWRRSCLVR